MSCRDEGVGGFLAIDKGFLGLRNLMGAMNLGARHWVLDASSSFFFRFDNISTTIIKQSYWSPMSLNNVAMIRKQLVLRVSNVTEYHFEMSKGRI